MIAHEVLHENLTHARALLAELREVPPGEDDQREPVVAEASARVQALGERLRARSLDEVRLRELARRLWAIAPIFVLAALLTRLRPHLAGPLFAGSAALGLTLFLALSAWKERSRAADDPRRTRVRTGPSDDRAR